MSAQTLAWAPLGRYRRVCGWIAAIMLVVPLLNGGTVLMREHPILLTRTLPTVAPQPAIPPAQTLPPAIIPAVRAALVADDAPDYTAFADSTDTLRIANSAHRFDATFAADGIRIAPASDSAWDLRASEIVVGDRRLALGAVQPTRATGRIEYRRDGLTEWYINGPNGLEQGFTLDAPPAGAEQFTLGIAVAGETALRADGGALLIGGLRYGDLAVTDATGTTLPAHLDATEGGIRIAVDARGAQWPVTVDPTLDAGDPRPRATRRITVR